MGGSHRKKVEPVKSPVQARLRNIAKVQFASASVLSVEAADRIDELEGAIKDAMTGGVPLDQLTALFGSDESKLGDGAASTTEGA